MLAGVAGLYPGVFLSLMLSQEESRPTGGANLEVFNGVCVCCGIVARNCVHGLFAGIRTYTKVVLPQHKTGTTTESQRDARKAPETSKSSTKMHHTDKPTTLFSTHVCVSLAILISRAFSAVVLGMILSCASSEMPFLAMLSFVALYNIIKQTSAHA